MMRLGATRSASMKIGKRDGLSFSFPNYIVIGTKDVDPYEGEYVITPKIYNEVELPTKDKLLSDDITVEKIPQYEVANAAGGNTLIMGDDYYG